MPASGKSAKDAVPHQARAAVELAHDEVVEPKDLLSQLDEAKKKELATQRSRDLQTLKSLVSLETLHTKIFFLV